MAKLPISLDAYVGPGRGRDLSLHKGGAEGFRKVVENFTTCLSSYDRRSLLLEEKVVVLGDTQVGKSSLLKRFIYDSYTDQGQSTIGLDVLKQRFIHAGLDLTLCIWDTAGQDRFHAMSNHFYRGAQACIAAFDLGAPLTLSHVKQWVDRLRKENSPIDDVCVFLVGCKSDMYHTVSDTHAEHVASELEAEYFEVSAKSGYNVRTLFDRVAYILFERALLRQAEEWKQQKTVKLTLEENIVEDSLLGDPGAGKGTENWKDVKRAQKRSPCCWAT